MAKLTKIKNGNYIGPNKYIINDSSDGKKEITFSPDQVVEEATPVGAEILNEIQKNGLYYLEGTKRVSGQNDIYDCTLEGIDQFDFTQLIVLFKADSNSTNSTIQLNISGQIYTVQTESIVANRVIALMLNQNKTAIPLLITTSEYKSTGDEIFNQQGANNLYIEVKRELDHKVSKSGDTITGTLKIDSNGGGNNIHLLSRGDVKGEIDINDEGIVFYNVVSNKILKLKNDGNAEYPANNLQTSAKEAVGAINELNDKIKTLNVCPYNVGDIYVTTKSENPATIWLGTTWSQIDGRFLYGTSGASKQTGGSNSVTLTIDNLPSHTHSANTASHTHTQPEHIHTIEGRFGHGTAEWDKITTSADNTYNRGKTNPGGGDATGEASPVTSIGSTGNGQAFDITPLYYTVHMWLRES